MGGEPVDELKSVVSHHTQAYGGIKVKLADVLAAKGITRNRLRTLTGVKYEVIDRYYKAKNVELVDLDFLAKTCFALGCKIEDLLEYQPPEVQ